MKSLVRRRFFRPVEGNIGFPGQSSPRVETNVVEGGIRHETPSGVESPVTADLGEARGGGQERQ